MAKYDLTSTIAEYLDRHMVFPLLKFLVLKELYPAEEILTVKLDLLEKTCMVDYAADIYKGLHGLNEGDAAPESFSERREQVLTKLAELQQSTAPLTQALEQDWVLQELRQDKRFNQEYLTNTVKVDMACLDKLYEFAKFQFDIGNYSVTAEYLTNFRVLSLDADKCHGALWGKFASEILMHNWDTAMEDLNRLKESLDENKSGSALEQLQQRTWLLHWSLFVFFNHEKGRDGIIEMFFQPQYINTIQTTCPHILRYLTAAVICNTRRNYVVKELVKAIQRGSNQYRDPITEFLECLYVNFDFEGAQQKLRECEAVLENDFFLLACRDEFIENARMFIFETYCRIHQVISINSLGEKLNMTTDEAEVWIVNLIRNARLDAKIDSKMGTVIMGSQVPSVYHQVIEATKGLSFRSSAMIETIEKKANSSKSSSMGADF
ncbi:eukaryotic translation initiation factor 3 subunit E [Sphaeroforma arctica JP610]|uniref:Eukaryotic translation initiation factor 3 subunit E n=1 Tax=Sphaeroforma arctica JP610 TaxID=667725 RepID=A0A0L0G816_9EUKA|nr:eukaryotic translation initiation factor 3 subunit E [Sphaeroforma arctica JP610]KNC84388.1 eukaryotic translation initiation factor 3 subunit E [Sphaeroforma arctica JP610]|eukprot:XP_014158290.1 eukaryotic translation initiation factor 3 subunit E [Sphaeroforma arctica JP610]